MVVHMRVRDAAATRQRILEQARRQFARHGYTAVTVRAVADAAGIVQRWFGATGEDPLLVLQRASGERPEAAEALASFLDANSLEPLHRYLRDSGLDDAEARSRAAAIDAFVLGVSTRRRVLRAELGDPADLQAWLGATIQRLADGTTT
jgi:Tetracyclin repressor-like, C-terminal domain/Bacterial regulatory proteins, tetR family